MYTHEIARTTATRDSSPVRARFLRRQASAHTDLRVDSKPAAAAVVEAAAAMVIQPLVLTRIH